MKVSTLLMTAALGSASSMAQGQQGASPHQSISGTISFAEHAKIPKGELKLYLGGTSHSNQRIELKLLSPLKSSGAKTSITFAASFPQMSQSATPIQLIARLERSDGWLIARGSVLMSYPETQQNITLFPVMY